jgi:histone H1/5
MPKQLTNEIITAAIEGYEVQKARIDAKVAELRALLSGGPAEPAAAPTAPTGKRKKFTAASRRKMALAQKARWAKIKNEAEPPAPAEAPKAKRKMSKEGLARIIAATKKRWRLQKAAAKAAAKKAPPKKTAVNTLAAKKTAPAAAQTAAAGTAAQ